MTSHLTGRLRPRSLRAAFLAGLSTFGVAAAAVVLPAISASAHGAASSPGSRTYLCFQDAHWTGGDLEARNPACQEAIAEGGKQPLWDWYGVSNSGTNGRTRGWIPDGKICSGNNPKYAAFDTPRDDWPATHLTSGANWNFRFPTIDGHPGTFYTYVTKDSYDPTTPLTWDDLEDDPFDTATFQSPNSSGPDNAEFAWDMTLPANKSGRHLLLSFWQRSDASGSFFNCSDVVFDGGNGEISGYPNDNEWKGGDPTPTDTPTSPPASTDPGSTDPGSTDPGGGTSDTCTAQVDVNAWPGGYLGTVTVVNRGEPRQPWEVTFTVPAGVSLFSGWNADVSLSGTTVTASAPAWNRILRTGDEASIGFVAAGPSSPPPSDVRLNGVACGGAGTPGPAPSSSAPSGEPDPTTPQTTPGVTSPAPTGAPGAVAGGFENQTGTVPSGAWAVSTSDCSGDGAATIDSSVAHSGEKSLRIDGAQGYCNHVFVASAEDLSALGPTVYVRFYVRHSTAQPASHTTFVAMEDANDGGKDLRIGGQNGALQWNRESDDATLPEQSPAGVAQSTPLPTGTWQCMEYSVDGSAGTAHTWLNGTEVAGLAADGSPTADIDKQWYAKSWKPAITDLRLGWESYGEGTDTLWFDDVAVGTSRIGC